MVESGKLGPGRRFFLWDTQPSHLTALGFFQFSRLFRPLLFPPGHQFYGMRIAFFRLIRMSNLE